jgi:hypothetical protein
MPVATAITMPVSLSDFDGSLESFSDWLMMGSLDEALPLEFVLPPTKMDADELSFDHISVVLSRSVTPPPESLPPSPYNSSSSSPSESRCASPNMYSALFMDDFFDSPSGASSSVSGSSSTYSSSPASPLSSPAVSFAASNNKLQGRRKSDEAKAPKIKKIAKGEVTKPSKRSKAVALASKRDSHNISERNRRQELKLSFNLLQNIVPTLVSTSRAHTGTILKETIAYVMALREQERELLESKSTLLAEQSRLMMTA